MEARGTRANRHPSFWWSGINHQLTAPGDAANRPPEFSKNVSTAIYAGFHMEHGFPDGPGLAGRLMVWICRQRAVISVCRMTLINAEQTMCVRAFQNGTQWTCKSAPAGPSLSPPGMVD
jgi:hypothetical protein